MKLYTVQYRVDGVWRIHPHLLSRLYARQTCHELCEKYGAARIYPAEVRS